MDVTLTVLEKSSQDIVKQINRFSPHLSRFQLDVADGQLVQNTTAHPSDYLQLLPTARNGLKPFPTIQYDFHLMVINPAPYLEYIYHMVTTLNIGTILVHYAIKPNFDRLKSLYPSLSFGMVLNANEDPINVSKDYDLSFFPVIQIMTIETGFQGNPFLPETLNKIEQLRTLHYRNKIYIDGGVNETTIADICKAPFHPDTLCVGSYLIKSTDEDIEKRIRFLKSSC